jgi:hypothetical protein
MVRTRSFLALASIAAWLAAGCSGAGAENEANDDLTSLSARTRKLSFEGIVYVEPGASNAVILERIRAQTQTAFGPLRESKIAVNSRELRDVDASTFQKRSVRIVDPERPRSVPVPNLEVRYTYTDDAIVPVSFAERSTIASAALNPYALTTRENQLRRECTANDSHSRPYPLWYEFNPRLPQCKEAMKAELAKVRKDRALVAGLGDDAVAASEVDRMYIPLTVNLGADTTAKGETYPEYDRLFGGGVDPNALVISLVYGPIDDKIPAAGPQADSGYAEWSDNLRQLLKARPFTLKPIPEGAEINTVRLSTGTVVRDLTLAKVLGWPSGETEGMEGLTGPERTEVKKVIGQRLYRHWLTLETPVKVKIGDAPERDFTIRVMTYFGVDTDIKPHAFAFKNSDVYIYNGHSYVGEGPLDPSNFSKQDFPKSYQILFVDSCVSYNYYHEGYLPLKQGGTKNLDFITNGLEAPSLGSGRATGKFVSKLIDGSGASYRELLETVKATDALRVVDGELDNSFKPSRTRVNVRTPAL